MPIKFYLYTGLRNLRRLISFRLGRQLKEGFLVTDTEFPSTCSIWSAALPRVYKNIRISQEGRSEKDSKSSNNLSSFEITLKEHNFLYFCGD